MTDFDRWMPYHTNAYPGFGKWTAANTDQVDHMRRLLRPYTYEQLKGATDRLYDQEDQPRGYGNHARAIRSILQGDSPVYGQSGKQLGPQVRHGQLVANCPDCMDEGMFEVLSPDCLRDIWAGKRDKGLRTCVIACTCANGSYVARTRKLPQYKPGHAIFKRTPDMTWDDAAALLKSFHQKSAPRPMDLATFTQQEF